MLLYTRLALVGLVASCGFSKLPALGSGTGGADDDISDAANEADGPAVISNLAVLAGHTGGPGYYDGVGSDAHFQQCQGAATDGGGNLYFACNTVIRKLVISTGVVSTLAGTFRTTSSIDGVGTDAHFTNAIRLTADGNGHLFVTDNEAIRRVDIATKTVTTFAGVVGVSGTTDGIGTLARFSTPTGITADGHGNLYVADLSSYVLRKIQISTATVSTVAGLAGTKAYTDGTGTTARFLLPVDLTADGSYVYISDAESMIRRFEIATGNVTTVAGQPTWGTADGIGTAAMFSQVLGISLDGIGNLYVSECQASIARLGNIRKIALSTQTVTTAMGTGTFGTADGAGSAAQFEYPTGIAMLNGSIGYMIDDGPASIRQISPTTVKTIAGSFAFAGSVDGVGDAAQFNSPALVASANGAVYLADRANYTIRAIDASSGAVTTLAGTVGIAATSAMAGDGTGSGAKFLLPTGMVAAPDGTLFVADWLHIRRIDPTTGVTTTIAGSTQGSQDGTGTAAQFNYASSIARGSDGNLYIADRQASSIRQLAPDTGVVKTVLRGVSGCDGIIADDVGHLFITTGSTIVRIDIADFSKTVIAGSTAGYADGNGTEAKFAYPRNLALDTHGNLYVADSGNSAIRKIAPNFDVTTIVGSPSTKAVVPGPLPASLNAPYGLAIVGSDLIITDDTENAVLRVNNIIPL